MPVDLSAIFSRLAEWASRARAQIEAWAQTRTGRRTLRILKNGVTLAVVVYLGYQMTQIGWGSIWDSLPTTPWFYVLFLALYFLLPTCQALAYSLIWNRPVRRLFLPMLKTGVYNKEVLSYSGEVYLFSWAQSHLDRSPREIAHHIKDNSIITSTASTITAVFLVAFFLISDLVEVPLLQDHRWLYVMGGLLGLAVLIGVGARFRRFVFYLPSSLILGLLGLHLGRFFLLQGLQVTQWAVTIPSVALQTWCTFLALQLIVPRLPLIPSQDLLFMAVSLEVAGVMAVPESALAGVLATHSALDKGLGALLFGLVSISERQDAHAASASPDAALDANAESLTSASAHAASEAGAESPSPPAASTTPPDARS